MNEDEDVNDAPVAEEHESQAEEVSRQVPLSALEAERAKRQETEAELRMYKQYMAKGTANDDEEEEDPDDVITVSNFKKGQQSFKREVLEQAFCDANPSAVQYVNENLPALINQKPWVKDVVESAPNRWARAHELLRDFSPKQANEKQLKRIEENAKKPASPAAVGKSAQHSKLDMLKGMAGKKEFREYRQKVLSGEIN